MRPKRCWYALVLLLLFLSVSLPSISQNSLRALNLNFASEAPDEVAIRALAEQFFTAFVRKDVDGFVRLWSVKSPDYATRRASTENLFKSLDRVEMKGLNVVRVEIKDEQAKLRLVVEINALDAKTGKAASGFGKMNRVLRLVKEGEWKVWRDVTAEEDLAAALMELKTDDERAVLLASEKDLEAVELRKALLNLGAQQRLKGEYSRALEHFRFASELARRIEDRAGVALALSEMGNVYRLRADYKQALEVLQRALAIGKEIDDKESISTSLTYMGSVYEALGNYVLAMDHLRQSLAIREALGNKEQIANVWNSMGIVYARQGDYNLALEYFQKTLKSKEEAGSKSGIANALNNIGNIYYYQGNYSLALENFQKSLTMRTELGEKQGVANTLSNIGNTYSRQRSNGELALEYHRKSLALREELGDKSGVANSLSNIGSIYLHEAQYEPAMESFQKTLKLNETLGIKRGIINSLLNIGVVYSRQENYPLAIDSSRRALKLSEEVGARDEIANLNANLAEFYHIQGNYTEALAAADRAATLSKEMGDLETLWESLAMSGRIRLALNKPVEARQAFEEAIATIESLRSQLAGAERDQQRFLEGKLSPYQAMVDLLITNNRPAEALAYAERAKARVLLSVLQGGRVDVTKTMTAGEQAEERRLRSETISLNTQISRERLRQQPDGARLRVLEANLQKARLSFEAFQSKLYAVHPELRTQRGEAQLINLEQSSELLADAQSALLEYTVTDKKTFLFVFTRSGGQTKAELTTYTIEITQNELEKSAENYRRLLAQRNPDFAEQARRLYDLLIAPAQKQLQGKTKLVVVPDGPLWNLPFQALQSKEGHYLIEDQAIAYAPSLTVLREMAGLRRKGRDTALGATPTLLAFGNPAIGKQAIERVKFVTRAEGLAPLPEAEGEVKALERLYDAAQSRIYIGAEAQEGRAKAEASKYRIIHLATHGILNDSSPMYSNLVLSQTANSSDEDGLLEAWEIMNMNLKADLVVLSACETARGRIGKGEGVIGLTWALFVAGAPTTLVSQWKVESAATAQLMLAFHKNFKAEFKNQKTKPSEAEALRHAIINLRGDERYRHPFYWAGFVVVGDGF